MNEAATILIVDDELFVRQLLMHILNQEGYECILAVDDSEALRKWSTSQFLSSYPTFGCLVLMELDFFGKWKRENLSQR